MLNEKIQKCLLKLVDRLDHKPLNKIYQEFKSYSKQSNLISNFVQMESTADQDYFPIQISEEDLQLLKNNQIFSARVIFLATCFRFNTKGTQFQSICTQQNIVYKRFMKLKDQYAERYLVDLGLIQKNLASNFGIRNWKTSYNYIYYQTKIEEIYREGTNYEFLENRHDYIQWMFPNHFQSMFNSNSWPMSYFQVDIFRKSRKLGLKILNSVRIFFNFLGIQLHPDYHYEIKQKKRLKDAIDINCHNHLRLRRVLACLSIVGFRNIALSLIKFLGELVRTKTIYSKWKYTFERQWEIYGNRNLKDALKLCFHPQDSFPQTHQVWRQLRSQLGLDPQQQVTINWNEYDQDSISKLTQILKTETSGRYQMRKFYESSSEEQKNQKEELKENQSSIMKQKLGQVMEQQKNQHQPQITIKQTEQVADSLSYPSQAIVQQKKQTPKQNQTQNKENGEQKMNQK